MKAFDVLGGPVRRRILELLAAGECGAGDVVEVIATEFALTQPAGSRQLRTLRENGFATVRAAGTPRLYALVETGYATSRTGGEPALTVGAAPGHPRRRTRPR